jgi:methylenetetrahydrofolate dehydrogenase (NADP+) / methenyltetrahydrofolate cyclohydrolase
MNARILTAAPVVEKTKNELKERCLLLKNRGITPSMSVVLVGNNPASLSYIRNKKKICEEVGAKFTLEQYPAEISEKEFLGHIDRLNKDPGTNGIIIQLPVSQQLRNLNLPDLVVPEKDIDGFHSQNTQALYVGSADLKLLLPCTPKGVIKLLQFYNVPISGQNVVVIGRSLIVGKPLSMLLTNLNATVTLAHSKTRDLRAFTQNADIVVAAIGIPHLLDASFFNPDRKTVVIDVGMNTLEGKLVGDCFRDKLLTTVDGLSPVPGGVGPMTVVSLIENLFVATEGQLKGNT